MRFNDFIFVPPFRGPAVVRFQTEGCRAVLGGWSERSRLLDVAVGEIFEANGYGAPGGERIVYRLPHPAPDGTTALSLTPLEFLERLALLIHPPRIHRHRYHGVLAPNAKLRYQVTALGHEQGRVHRVGEFAWDSHNGPNDRPRLSR